MTNKTTMGKLEFLNWIGSEDDAVKLFESYGWPKQRFCRKCEYTDTNVQNSRNYYYRYKGCHAQLSARMGTVVAEPSRIPMKEWLWVMYKISVSRKGISSLHLVEQLNRPKNTTCSMLERLKEVFGNKQCVLNGMVENDETYHSGKEKNKHESKKLHAGRGSIGKQPVHGIRERGGEVVAKPVPYADVKNILGNIHKHVESGSTVFTDEHRFTAS